MEIDQSTLLEKIGRDWDARARENAHHYVVNSQWGWSDEDFFEGGRRTVANEILTDTQNIFQGRRPEEMRILEIGCGSGRVTRALGELFREVHTVDVSEEMILLAREACRHQSNVFIHKNDGMDLSILADLSGTFDFAFSSCCFQHIPSHRIIENYVRQVSELLRPKALFKFEVQGYVELERDADDTWCGVSLSDADAVSLAERCGFEPGYRVGAGQECFWLWFFKK